MIQSPSEPIVPDFLGERSGWRMLPTLNLMKRTGQTFRNPTLELEFANIGIIETSGSGKSTLFQLMMHFYDPEEGRLALDGCDIRLQDPIISIARASDRLLR